jgi:poly(3-hydroxybutyrate) depolymerase
MQIAHWRRAFTAAAPVLVALLSMLSAFTAANEAAGGDGEDPPTRRNQTAAAEGATRTHVLAVGKARFVDPPQQQKRAVDAVRKVTEATSRLGPRVLADSLSEKVMTREQFLRGEANERVTGSVFLARLRQLAETTGPQDTVIIYTHTHGVKRGVANPNSPGGIVLDPPFLRFGHRGVLTWDEYVEHILRIPAKNVVVLTMSCFSGGLVHYLESPTVRAQWEHRQQEGRNLVVLTSQDNDTVSPPIVVDRELVNPFTRAVATAFEGGADGFDAAGAEPGKKGTADGIMTIGELIDCALYNTEHTPSESSKRPNTARPQITGAFNREAVLGRFADTSGGEESTEPTPADLLSPGRHALSLAVEGRQRSYLVHVPPRAGRSTPLPVVIMFHGGGGSAESARRETGWDRKADRDGFLAVFPEGTPPDPSRPGRFIGNPQTWNDGSARDLAAVRLGTPDVSFVEALIKDLQTRCLVDERRIYATGFSNGASMAFRVARERADLVAAIAPVAGTDWLTGVQPARAVPLLYITGTADP